MMPDEVEQRVRVLQAELLAAVEERERRRAHPQAWWLGR